MIYKRHFANKRLTRTCKADAKTSVSTLSGPRNCEHCGRGLPFVD
jgi:hypothetical protein